MANRILREGQLIIQISPAAYMMSFQTSAELYTCRLRHKRGFLQQGVYFLLVGLEANLALHPCLNSVLEWR